MEIENLIWVDDWRPTNDIEVSQMMKILKESEREKNRLLKNINDEIEILENKGKEVEDEHYKLSERINNLCQFYIKNEVLKEDLKETKTSLKYKLARGEIILKKPSKKIMKPTKEQETYLIKNYPEFKEEVINFKWGEFKKNLEINNDKIINKKTGELINGLQIEETPEEINVKIY